VTADSRTGTRAAPPRLRERGLDADDVAVPSSASTLVAQPLVDLSPWLVGCSEPAAVGASCDGAVLAAAPVADDAGTARFRVVEWCGGTARCVEVVGKGEAWATSLRFVQRLPDGFLLAGARCWWRRTGVEENAATYDWSGRLVRRFTLGDGIADVRTTPNGRVWVSYFDEGIFGNRGWNHPGPPSLGEPGCVGFDSTGVIRARFDGDTAGAGPIADVYALNVAGDESPKPGCSA
jgi:hypothetical protein